MTEHPKLFMEQETYGIVESSIFSLLLFILNFLIFVETFREKFYWIFMLYNFFVIFVLVNVIVNKKYPKIKTKDL